MRQSRRGRRRWMPPHRWLLLLGSLLIFALALLSVNKEVGSDAKLTLLVSQALLDHGSIRLDPYQDDLIVDTPFQETISANLITVHNDHYYNYFPLGPSVLSVPFVGPARVLGLDMRTIDNFRLQTILAALTVVLVFWLIYRLGLYFTKPMSSAVIAFFSVAGSTLLSTLGSALWSLNFTTVILLLATLLLVRGEKGQGFRPFLLGLLLFLAFFNRPSTIAFIVPALVYLLWKDRLLFLKTGVTALILLAAFVLWSRFEYGLWLPPYYSPGRFADEFPPVWIGLLGNLVSPSRGLFFFSPLFLLLIAGVTMYWRSLMRKPLFWLSVAWFGLALLLVARGVIWWGGFSFGPRLLTDALPALILLLFMLWAEVQWQADLSQQRVVAAAFVALGLIACFIHFSGLYRGSTQRWNLYALAQPSPGTGALGDMFDWRYAQFLASNEEICQMEGEKMAAYLAIEDSLAPYTLGTPIAANADQGASTDFLRALELAGNQPDEKPLGADQSPAGLEYASYAPVIGRPANVALFAGWEHYFPASGFRQSICPQTAIVLLIDEDIPSSGDLILRVRGQAHGTQRMGVTINNAYIGEEMWPDGEGELIFRFSADLLQAATHSVILFDFPDAHTNSVSWDNYRLAVDDRHLAFRLHQATIERAEDP